MRRLSGRALALTFAGASVATIGLYAVMAPMELAMRAAGHGILDLEFAWSAQQVATIVEDWGQQVTATARQQILVDFAFIPTYGLAVGTAAEWARRRLDSQGVAGRGLAALPWLAPVAMVADVVENLALLRALSASELADTVVWAAPVASSAATVKFTLLAMALATVLGTVATALRHRRRQRHT